MSRDFRIELLPFLAEFERKKKKKEKERKEEQDDRRMLCKWRVGRKSSSLINYSSTFRARHARYPPKLERTCSRCQIRLDSAKWITSLHLPPPPRTFNTAFNAARPLYFTRRTQSSLSPPPFVVDLCVCSRKIKLSHYRATAVDRSLFWRQEV